MKFHTFPHGLKNSFDPNRSLLVVTKKKIHCYKTDVQIKTIYTQSRCPAPM